MKLFGEWRETWRRSLCYSACRLPKHSLALFPTSEDQYPPPFLKMRALFNCPAYRRILRVTPVYSLSKNTMQSVKVSIYFEVFITLWVSY